MQIKEKLIYLKHRMTIYPGHYYSPMPSLKEVLRYINLFENDVEEVPGINLRNIEQKEVMKKCQKYYDELVLEKLGGGEILF